MNTCAHIYCRAPMPSGAEACPVCDHPVDPAKLKDPGFLMRSVGGLPKLGPILDLHQILPRHPMALPAQRMLMEGLDIERALLQSVPPEAQKLQGNAELAEVRAKHPEQFVTSWYIDPREEGALEQLQAARAADAQVIKLLPVAGYRLDEERFHPFWEAVQDMGLVLLVHTGFITARHKEEEHAAGRFFNASFGDPLQLDEPARRFPRARILMAHGGGAIFHEAGAQLLTQHENIRADISGMGIFALQRWLKLGVTLDWSQVVWGNDSPFFHYPMNLRLLVHSLERAGAQELLRPLLYDNGQRLLQDWLA